MKRDENEIDGMGLAKERRMQEEIDYEEMLRRLVRLRDQDHRARGGGIVNPPNV